MPSEPPIQLGSQNGSILVVVRNDGSGQSDVYQIPVNAVITIQPAVGFGPVNQTVTGGSGLGTSLAVNQLLVSDGAV